MLKQAIARSTEGVVECCLERFLTEAARECQHGDGKGPADVNILTRAFQRTHPRSSASGG